MNSKKLNSILTSIFKKKRYFHIIVGSLFIVSTLIYIYIFSLPVIVNQEINENTIIQKTEFNLEADIAPNILNTNGGVIQLDEGVFTTVTNDIIVNINSTIESDKPVALNGTKKVILKLIARDLWDKEFILSGDSNFNLEGTNNKIFSSNYSIGLSQIKSFIETVEEELNIRSGNYIFEIRPVVSGTITFGNEEIPLDESPYFIIDYSDQKIKAGEVENIFSKTTPIINNVSVPQNLKVFNLEIPMKQAKSYFSVAYVLILIVLAVLIVRYVKYNRSNRVVETEIKKIDKKYRARIINTVKDVKELSQEKIYLDAFRSIITISDEKECPVLRYEGHYEVIYYVISDGFMYLYKVDKNKEEKIEIQNALIKEV